MLLVGGWCFVEKLQKYWDIWETEARTSENESVAVTAMTHFSCQSMLCLTT